MNDRRGGGARWRPLAALARFLRTPKLIVAELLAVVAAGLVLATLPQDPTPAEAARFVLRHPVAGPAVRALGLDRLATSPSFGALLLLCGASLAVVVKDQWRRLVRLWKAPLTVESFAGAPFRATFERPAGHGRGTGVVLRRGRRLGLLGSPLFHSGLLAVIAAGFLKLLFQQNALVQLLETDPLPPRADAWGLQRTGPLAVPFRFDRPLVMEALDIERYPSGGVKRMAARCRLGEEAFVLSVEKPIDLAGARLYLLNGRFGVSALLEVGTPGGAGRYRIDLEHVGGEVYEATWMAPGGVRLSLRQRPPEPGASPAELEVRGERGRALAFVGTLAPGEELSADGVRVKLMGTAWWAQFAARRDPALPLAYGGIVTALLGALLMVAANKVDTAVVVTASDRGERVVVALRAQRFALAYAERFAALVRAEGGPAELS